MANDDDSHDSGRKDNSGDKDSQHRDQHNKDQQKGFDLIKKLISAGVGAAFMTEESIRNYLSELKLPKEALNFILQGATKSKEELMDRVGNEIIKIVHKIDFVEEASRFVENHKFRITAEIDVVKKEK